MGGQLSSECPGELAPQEESALGGSGVEGACSSHSLLVVEGSEVAGNVFPDSLDLGELGSAA